MICNRSVSKIQAILVLNERKKEKKREVGNIAFLLLRVLCKIQLPESVVIRCYCNWSCSIFQSFELHFFITRINHKIEGISENRYAYSCMFLFIGYTWSKKAVELEDYFESWDKNINKYQDELKYSWRPNVQPELKWPNVKCSKRLKGGKDTFR